MEIYNELVKWLKILACLDLVFRENLKKIRRPGDPFQGIHELDIRLKIDCYSTRILKNCSKKKDISHVLFTAAHIVMYF
jgi:hypothetical protein